MPEIAFERAGATLYAIERGAGRPIILLHGGLANHLACRGFGDPVAVTYRVVTPDVRGRGRSTTPASCRGIASPTTSPRSSAISASPNAVIGGVSFGAGMAVRTALRHPELVDARPAHAGVRRRRCRAHARARRRDAGDGRRWKSRGRRGHRGDLPAVRSVAAGDPRSHPPGSRTTTRRASRRRRSSSRPARSRSRTASELAAITAPTLVVPGTDPYHPREVAELYAKHLPRVTVVDTLDFTAAIDAFLTRA